MFCARVTLKDLVDYSHTSDQLKLYVILPVETVLHLTSDLWKKPVTICVQVLWSNVTFIKILVVKIHFTILNLIGTRIKRPTLQILLELILSKT